MWWVRYLLSGFSFLGISEEAPLHQTKRVLEIFVPATLTLVALGVFVFLRNYMVPGVIKALDDKLFQLVVFMVPFHLAALAALATFQNPVLDKPPTGAKASVKCWSNEDNDWFLHFITMREYACKLFGYLCTLGIIYLVFSISASLVNFSVIQWVSNPLIGRVTFAVIVLFFWHYIVMSLYAIYFLINKTVKSK